MTTPSMPGLSIDDVKRMGALWFSTPMSKLNAAIAADPRMSQLAAAAKSAGLDFTSILRETPVNRSGTVLPAATGFLSKYGSVLTPIAKSVAPVSTTSGIKATVPTATPAASTGAALDPFDPNVLKRLANMFSTQTWAQVRATVASDPQLRALWDKISAAGYDPEKFMRDSPYDRAGNLAATSNALFQKNYANLYTGTPQAQTDSFNRAAGNQTTVSPTGPSQYSIGATTTTAPVSAAGDRLNQSTGLPIPGAQITPSAITAADLNRTGTTVSVNGQNMSTAGGDSVSLQNGLNAQNPSEVAQNLQELQLARLPVGQFVQQQQNAVNAMTNQPKPDVYAQEQSRLNSPFAIRQKALDAYRTGAIKPA